MTVCHVERPALVLGSTQRRDQVIADPGMEVARRRSGGGAVLVEPGRLVWVDVVVPAEDPLWQLDVGRAAWWVGDAWADALAALSIAGAQVHRGGPVRSAWSDRACFAGLGAGEVTVGGRKVVGIAQRRRRVGALFQCAVPLAFDAPGLAGLLELPAAERAQAVTHLAAGVGTVPRPAGAITAAFARALETR